MHTLSWKSTSEMAQIVFYINLHILSLFILYHLGIVTQAKERRHEAQEHIQTTYETETHIQTFTFIRDIRLGNRRVITLTN